MNFDQGDTVRATGQLARLAGMGDWDDAVELALRVLGGDQVTASLFARIASLLLDAQMVDAAEAYLQEGRSRWPKDIWLPWHHARLATDHQDFDVALERWRHLAAEYPESPLGLCGLGDLHRRTGREDAAAGFFAEADSRYQDYVWAAHGHAFSSSIRHDWTAAAVRWASVRERFPNHLQAHQELAHALVEDGRLTEAQAGVRIAIAAFPEVKDLVDLSRRVEERIRYAPRIPDSAAAVGDRLPVAVDSAPADVSADITRFVTVSDAPARLRNTAGRAFATGAKFSAYLSLYEDWELLRPSLESIVPFIDELVVVDGAYDWMAGFVRAVGRDPSCSSPRVYEQLANLGVPLKVITGTWPNEHVKRAAGYDACSQRYIYAVDADEIEFVDPEAVSRFVAGSYPAAQKVMPPIYYTPEWVEATSLSAPVPRKGFLFDSTLVNGQQHLSYLWLVNGPDSPELVPVAPASIEAIGVTAHMTLWRSPDGARNRAAFYMLNWLRNFGCPWMPEFKDRAQPDLDAFFTKVDPWTFNNMLLITTTCAGDFEFKDRIVCQSPLNERQRAAVAPYYDKFLLRQEANNLRITSSFQWMVQGNITRIDITSDNALAALERDGQIAIEFRKPPVSADASLHCLSVDSPWEHKIKLHGRIAANRLEIVVPPELRERRFLRRVLRFQVWTRDPLPLQEFRCVAA